MGASPATSTMAGMVSGNRQRNSITRLRWGSRRRTQIMVGTSSTSMPSEVRTANPNEARMAATRSGVCAMVSHAFSVRGASSVTPRVENSNMAPIGTRKKAPSTRKTAIRKIWSLRRRLRLIWTTSRRRSLQPLRRPPLQHRIEHHDHRDDHDHYQGERRGDSGVRQADFAGERVGDQQRGDDAALVDQRSNGGIGRKCVGEEQQRAAEKGRRQEWAGDVAPVMPGATTEALGGLAPLGPNPVQGRQEHEHHEGDLEIGVDEDEPPQLIKPNAVGVDVHAMLL